MPLTIDDVAAVSDADRHTDRSTITIAQLEEAYRNSPIVNAA